MNALCHSDSDVGRVIGAGTVSRRCSGLLVIDSRTKAPARAARYGAEWSAAHHRPQAVVTGEHEDSESLVTKGLVGDLCLV